MPIIATKPSIIAKFTATGYFDDKMFPTLPITTFNIAIPALGKINCIGRGTLYKPAE
jgi:hypothetical protein